MRNKECSVRFLSDCGEVFKGRERVGFFPWFVRHTNAKTLEKGTVVERSKIAKIKIIFPHRQMQCLMECNVGPRGLSSVRMNCIS